MVGGTISSRLAALQSEASVKLGAVAVVAEQRLQGAEVGTAYRVVRASALSAVARFGTELEAHLAERSRHGPRSEDLRALLSWLEAEVAIVEDGLASPARLAAMAARLRIVHVAGPTPTSLDSCT